MARTRSKPSTKTKQSTPQPTITSSNCKPLPPSVSNPPKLFVLPKDTSPSSRIVTLDNPANGTPSRYLFCPEKGFYEFTRIAAPKKAPRSWLITSEKSLEDAEKGGKKEEGEDGAQDCMDLGTGYITKSADLFIATPIDILFLILPALAPKSAKEEKQHFISLDDHLDTISASSRHFKVLLSQSPSLKAMVERRMSAFCDTVDAGDETMYRISNTKLLSVLVKKAERMCKNGLPASMEEKFIKPALEIPIMNIKREDTTATSTIEDTQDSAIQIDSQTSTSTSTPADSQTTIESQSTTATSTSTNPSEELTNKTLTTPPAVPHLLRLRTSLTYLLTSYIPTTLHAPLHTLLNSPALHPHASNASSTLPDFTPLDTHLAAISKLRSEAYALRSISDNISRKRGYEEDEEKIAEREEKKRKKEEEEKRKKGESRGIKQLKKVDTSGMMKLSSFFAKAPAKKKA